MKPAQVAEVKGKFCRIILDEAHTIRNCSSNKMGKALLTFEAPSRWLFTGTIAYDSMLDVIGLLLFLERPEWSDPQDRNIYLENGEYNVPYCRYMADIGYTHPGITEGAGSVQGQDMPAPEGWVFESRRVNRSRYRTRKFPLMFDVNRERDSSVPAQSRVGIHGGQKKRGKAADVAQPFFCNPFNFYSPHNQNNVWVATTAAFRYYIEPHILQSEQTDESRGTIYRRFRMLLSELVMARSKSHISIEHVHLLTCVQIKIP